MTSTNQEKYRLQAPNNCPKIVANKSQGLLSIKQVDSPCLRSHYFGMPLETIIKGSHLFF